MMIIMLISIMIMIMMLMPILCRRPLAFISGYWAVPALNRDTCVPPSLSCESFLVLNIVHFIHFSLSFICYCYQPSWIFRVSLPTPLPIIQA